MGRSGNGREWARDGVWKALAFYATPVYIMMSNLFLILFCEFAVGRYHCFLLVNEL